MNDKTHDDPVLVEVIRRAGAYRWASLPPLPMQAPSRIAPVFISAGRLSGEDFAPASLDSPAVAEAHRRERELLAQGFARILTEPRLQYCAMPMREWELLCPEIRRELTGVSRSPLSVHDSMAWSVSHEWWAPRWCLFVMHQPGSRRVRRGWFWMFRLSAECRAALESHAVLVREVIPNARASEDFHRHLRRFIVELWNESPWRCGYPELRAAVTELQETGRVLSQRCGRSRRRTAERRRGRALRALDRLQADLGIDPGSISSESIVGL